MATGKTNAVVGSSGSGSVDWSVVTAAQADVRSGKKFYNSSGTLVSGSATTKAAATITPTTSNQTIASGTYLTGTQTIKGDANLKASNIKSGVSIFNVAGTYAPASPYIASGSFTGTGSSQTISVGGGVLSSTPNLVMWKISTSDSSTTANKIQLATGDSSSGTSAGRGSVYQTYNFYSSGSVSVSVGSTSVTFSPSGLEFTSGVTYYYTMVFHP